MRRSRRDSLPLRFGSPPNDLVNGQSRRASTELPRSASRRRTLHRVSAQFLVTAGDNPERIRSEAAFAKLCGVAPQTASSGKTTGRHRLSRSGDRQANNALYVIAIVRLRHHQPTRDYIARRTAEGLSKREILRCLKRYITREVYANLPRRHQPKPVAPAADTT